MIRPHHPRPVKRNQPVPRENLIPLDVLTRMPYKAAPFTPKFKPFLGNIPATEQFTILLSGPSGTGKSTLCLLLAKEFSRMGHVLYVTSEERAHSGTQRQRAKLLNITSRRIWMHDTTRYEHVKRELATGAYKFCFIDSIQEMDVRNDILLEIIEMFPNVCFVFVAQVDWSEKKSRGSSSWPHKVMIRIWTDKEKDGSRYAYNVKNRYAPTQQKMFLFRPASVSAAPDTQSANRYNDVMESYRKKGSRIWRH